MTMLTPVDSASLHLGSLRSEIWNKAIYDEEAQIGSEVFVKLVLKSADLEALRNYFSLLSRIPLFTTNSSIAYSFPDLSGVSLNSTTSAETLDYTQTEEPIVELSSNQESVSFRELLVLQENIHRRLKREIEEAREAEAAYWRFFDSEDTEE